MCSAHKTWPVRMVAAVMTLALVLASALAAYEHAAGHPHALAGSADIGHAHDADGFNAGGGPGHHHAGYGHEDGGTTKSGCGNDACNCLCAGGCAILTAVAVMEHPLSASPATGLAVLLDGAEPSGLERPPKASIPA